MLLKLFVIFHEKLYKEHYEIDERYKKYITFYGTNENYIKTIPDELKDMDFVYEYELPHYDPRLQKLGYMDNSLFYHVAYNASLTKDVKWIGVLQYDMKLTNEFFEELLFNISDCIPKIIGFNEAKWKEHNYVKYFEMYKVYADLRLYLGNTKLLHEESSVEKSCILCNAFCVPKDIFNQYCLWFISVRHEIKSEIYRHGNTYASVLERLSTMFLGLYPDIETIFMYERIHNSVKPVCPYAPYYK